MSNVNGMLIIREDATISEIKIPADIMKTLEYIYSGKHGYLGHSQWTFVRQLLGVNIPAACAKAFQP